MSHEPAANSPHVEPRDLDVPPDFDPVPGEEPRSTDLAPLSTTTKRPRRGELHGADDPHGFFDNRGASLRTVRREP